MRKLVLFLVFVLFVSAELPRPDVTVNIPMRDGHEIATDLYFPDPTIGHNNPATTPCILVRSAAGRHALPALSALPLVQAGYVVAISDTRSSMDKEGKTMPCLDDGWGEKRDGFDTVEWLANSPYSNGKIGTFGPSALGIVQLMLAPTTPNGLKSQYIQFACGSVYHHAAFPAGQFHKHQIEGWFQYYANHPSVVSRVRNERRYSSFWSQMDALPLSSQVKVPAVFVGGWFDTFSQGTIDAFLARQNHGGEGAKGQQKLIIGPWAHFWPADKKIGDFTVPEKGYAPPHNITADKWFDYTLKGDQNGVDKVPAIQYYVMGPLDGSPSKGNVWKSADTWPPKFKLTPLYLQSDNTLSKEASRNSKTFSYVYDPSNPIPTVGGRNLFLESGPKDQSEIEKRSDIVIFNTEPLEKDLEITGRVIAQLYFATDAEDTDVSVRLSDVYPDGKSYLILDNTHRLGHLRDHFKANQPIPVNVDLHTTSIVFAKGHKIRLSVSSSNYPRFEKNLNVRMNADGEPLGEPRPAKNSLFVGGKYPSQLLLPVIE